jgi:hypothetical protein
MPTIRLTPRSAAYASSTLLLAALTACGGGGDDAPAPAAAPAPTLISSANANTVAARGYETANALFDASMGATDQLKSGDSLANGPALDLVRFALAQVQTVVAGGLGAGPGVKRSPMMTKATTNESVQCPSGGSISASFVDQNGNGEADPGDSATITFNGCVADGETVTGTMAFTIQAYTSSLAADSVRAVYTFRDLRSASGGVVSSVNGDMTLAATISNVSPFTSDVTLSGTNLAIVDGGESRTLSGYSGRLLTDDSRRTYSYSVSGSVSGSGIPGMLALSTPTAISGSYSGDPTAGRLVMSGAGNASVSLTVAPPTGVVLALDANGDGTPESQQTLTWAQLDAL